MGTIFAAEGQIQRLKLSIEVTKGKLRKGRPSREQAQLLRSRIAQIESRIGLYREIIYFCRCFGDGIAFIYLDKYAIKQAFYKIETTERRESSGALFGKQGLASEIQLFEEAIQKCIPAVLADLTNSIRYGDLCLLGDNDPVFIEVKSGKWIGERGRKQSNAIAKLHEFYQTDRAQGLRGFHEVHRVALPVAEVTHTRAMNQCIERAYEQGWATTNPETGLYYAAITDDNTKIESVFASMTLTQPHVYMLNTAKSNHEWAPYTPFTLTIKNADHLYDFIRGDLILIVLVDIPVLCSAVKRGGYEVFWEEGEDYPLKLKGEGTDNIGGLSQHFIDRIAFEFVSLAWAAAVQNSGMDRREEIWDECLSANDAS